MATLAIALVCLTLGACERPAPGAKSTLKALSAEPIHHKAPERSVLLGESKDPGGDSGIVGRPPAITQVLTSTDSVETIAHYYRSSFPEHKLRNNGTPSGDDAFLIGVRARHPAPSGGVSVRITSAKPDLSIPNMPELPNPPAGHRSWIVVSAFG